jgi:cytochrome c biogenesis factor
MKNYCTGFTLFFSVTTISQVLAILALRNGRNRHAKIMCVIGMLSFGFGLSTLLLGNALINIHKADTNIRMAKELASKNVEQN